MRASGGRPTLLMKNAAYPTFSRDGLWIYLSSPDPQGELRIFKIPADGGPPVQVTGNEGTLAIESGGGDLYYVDRTDRSGSVWRLPVAGSPPIAILHGIVLGNFDVVDRGIYYIDPVRRRRWRVCERSAGRRDAAALLRLRHAAVDHSGRRARHRHIWSQRHTRRPDRFLFSS